MGAKIGDAVGIDVAFDGIIKGAGHLAGFELESDGDDKITVFGGGIEDALAVGELEVGFGEGSERIGGGVVDVDFGEGIGDFLAVGADILDWGGGGETGDFAQGFDAGQAFVAGISDDVIPELAPHNF